MTDARGRLLGLCLLLIVAAVTRADADERTRAEAKRLKDLGATAITRGDNLAALDLFQAAHRLYPSPNLRFNVALALTNLGRHVEAATELAAFVSEATPDTPRLALEHARAELAGATAMLARLAVAARDGAVVRVDGRPRGVLRSPGPCGSSRVSTCWWCSATVAHPMRPC